MASGGKDACVSVAVEGRGGAGNRAERSTTAKEKQLLPKNEPKVGQRPQCVLREG